MNKMYLLGDQFGNFALWDKQIETVDTLEKPLPMLVVVNSAFVASKTKILKNKINCGLEQQNFQWENAPFCVECREFNRNTLIGLKALNGFSIGKTDLPVRFLTMSGDKPERLYETLLKAKVTSAEKILGFDIDGKIVQTLVRKDFKYFEI
jgi:hypothetical protein